MQRARKPRPRWRGALTLLWAALSLGPLGCASINARSVARDAERQQDYDRAVVEYTKVVRADPDDLNARAGLARVKLRASLGHFTRARRLAAASKLEEALVEYQIAYELNPTSGDIERELSSTRQTLRTKLAIEREGRTELETLVARARESPPPGLDLPLDADLPDSLVFRQAGSRDVFTAIARFADINLVFDPAFRDTPISVELRGVSLRDALDSIAASTGTFYRVTAPRTISVVPDTPAKRREYEDEVVQTFYLSNADLQETIDLLRIVIDARRVAPVNATNAITIKDSPERVAAAGRVIAAIDKARPEVIIDVELMEVDRRHLMEYGLQIASPGSDGISGQLDANAEDLTLEDVLNLTQADVLVTNLPGLFYRLLKNDSGTRTLANPQLRTSEGLAAQARFGERVPVPVTTFAPIATGGVAQQPITSFNYENIGVNIDITPRTHHDDDVSLELSLEISAISGTGFGGLPTFGNRSINTTIRLRDGETSMLAGLIRDDERQVLAGVPGLSDIPLIGRLFAYNRTETQQTDIVLTLTPHIIRVLDLTEADLAPFRVASETATALTELPVFPGRPPRDPQAPAADSPAEVPSPAPSPGPILPPDVPGRPPR